MADILYIVIPCFNEEEVLPETERRLSNIPKHLLKPEALHLVTLPLLIYIPLI